MVSISFSSTVLTTICVDLLYVGKVKVVVDPFFEFGHDLVDFLIITTAVLDLLLEIFKGLGDFFFCRMSSKERRLARLRCRRVSMSRLGRAEARTMGPY